MIPGPVGRGRDGQGVGRERLHLGGWKLFEARGVSSRFSKMGGAGGEEVGGGGHQLMKWAKDAGGGKHKTQGGSAWCIVLLTGRGNSCGD